MSEDEARQAVIGLLTEKADRALAAAERDYAAGDYALAINRVYYACFYTVSAVLLREKRQYVKHVGLKAALHKYLVHTGRLRAELGNFYDRAFEERNEADYQTDIKFDAVTAANRIAGAKEFVAEARRLLTEAPPNSRPPASGA